MTTALARMLALAALVGLAVPAHAMADESLAGSGSITYTWQGDPAHGCAAVGVCGVQGALTLVLVGGSSASAFGGTLDIGLPSTATVRVSGPGGDCVDLPSAQFAGELFVSRERRGLVGRIEPPLSSSRCAGPLPADLARLTLSVRRFGGRQPSYDLHTTRSFVAGPFTGELVSTAVLRHANGGSSSSSSSSSSSGPPAGPAHRAFREQVTLRYRLAALPSALDATFAGESDPFCAALASCGASGALALSIPHFERTLVVSASRVVPRPVAASQAIADLRAGRLAVQSGEELPLRRSSVVTADTERFVAADGSRCQATTRSRQAQAFFVPGVPPGGAQIARARPALTAVLTESFGSSLLRTYCPGPLDTDVFGNRNSTLATGVVGLTQLLRRRSVVSLSTTGSFSGPGYVGTRSGAIRLSMTLERVQARSVPTTVRGRATS